MKSALEATQIVGMDAQGKIDLSAPHPPLQYLGMAIGKGQRPTIGGIQLQFHRDVATRHARFQRRQKGWDAVPSQGRNRHRLTAPIMAQQPLALFRLQQVDLVEHLQHGPLGRYAQLLQHLQHIRFLGCAFVMGGVADMDDHIRR